MSIVRIRILHRIRIAIKNLIYFDNIIIRFILVVTSSQDDSCERDYI